MKKFKLIAGKEFLRLKCSYCDPFSFFKAMGLMGIQKIKVKKFQQGRFTKVIKFTAKARGRLIKFSEIYPVGSAPTWSLCGDLEELAKSCGFLLEVGDWEEDLKNEKIQINSR